MTEIERYECGGSMKRPARKDGKDVCPACKTYQGLTTVRTVPSHIITRVWKTREEWLKEI